MIQKNIQSETILFKDEPYMAQILLSYWLMSINQEKGRYLSCNNEEDKISEEDTSNYMVNLFCIYLKCNTSTNNI